MPNVPYLDVGQLQLVSSIDAGDHPHGPGSKIPPCAAPMGPVAEWTTYVLCLDRFIKRLPCGGFPDWLVSTSHLVGTHG